MSYVLDLTGQEFGRLTVICIAERIEGYILWTCRCICGNINKVRTSKLINRTTKSCGCWRKDQARFRSGPNHYKYNHIIDRKLQRCNNLECIQWRKAILAKDGWTCDISGVWITNNINHNAYLKAYLKDIKNGPNNSTIGKQLA